MFGDLVSAGSAMVMAAFVLLCCSVLARSH